MNSELDPRATGDALPSPFREATGAQVAELLNQELERRTRQDSDALELAMEAWSARVTAELLPRAEALRERRVEIEHRISEIARVPSESMAQDLANLVVDQLVHQAGLPAEEAFDLHRRLVADSRGLRKARNLINHRRKCVTAVLAILGAVEERTTRRMRTMTDTEAGIRDRLLQERIDAPSDLRGWAERAFELFAQVVSGERPLAPSMLNNYRVEWLDFITSLELEFKSHSAPAPRPSAFERRFVRALQEIDAPSAGSFLTWAMRSATNSTLWQPQPGPVTPASAPERNWPTSTRSVPSPQATRLEIRRGPQGTTLSIGPALIGDQNAEELALRLSLELVDPQDPTEVVVRVVGEQSPAIEITLATQDAGRIGAAFLRAQELLAASR